MMEFLNMVFQTIGLDKRDVIYPVHLLEECKE